MSSQLLTALSGIFGLYCIGREVRRIIRLKQIRISNLILIMYGITYGIVLSLLLLFNDMGIYRTQGTFLMVDYSSQGLKYLTWWFFAAVIGYISFRSAGILRIKESSRQQNAESPPTQAQSVLLERLQYTSVVCLAIGIVCFWIWTSGWGGYMNMFLNAREIRNGSYGIKNTVAFFAKPAHIVATVSIMSVFLVKQRKNVLLNKVIFVISFVISLLYYLAKDGRMIMAMYLLIVLFMWNDMFEKQTNITKKLVKLGFGFALFVVIVLNMDKITYLLRYGTDLVANDSETALQSIMDELSYIYVAGQTSLKQFLSGGSPFLIGHDVVSGLFAWVPSALTPKGLINIWSYNTQLVAGSKALAQYPCDLISTSIYDLGVFGPIILPAVWGAIINKLERMKKAGSSPIFIVLYYGMSMTLLRGINYSMISSTVASMFHLFVAAVVFWVMGRVKIK